MSLRPPHATLLAAAAGLLLGACSGSLYDAAGVPKVEANVCDPELTHTCPPDPTCYPKTDPDHCGTTCEVCGAAPANGRRECVQAPAGGYVCGFTCTAPARACSNPAACLPDDVNACGAACQDCNAVKPAGTVATCVPGAAGNECAYACSAGWFACASGCCQPAVASAAKRILAAASGSLRMSSLASSSAASTAP